MDQSYASHGRPVLQIHHHHQFFSLRSQTNIVPQQLPSWLILSKTWKRSLVLVRMSPAHWRGEHPLLPLVNLRGSCFTQFPWDLHQDGVMVSTGTMMSNEQGLYGGPQQLYLREDLWR